MYNRTETKDLKGFDKKYVELLYRLGVQYVDEFYSYACYEREPTKNHLGVDDSELERLVKLSETVLDQKFIDDCKKPLQLYPRGLILDDESSK